MTNAVDPDPSDSSAAPWRKARRSMASGNNCVEVRVDGEKVHVRDSKNPTGPSLAFTLQQWVSLLTMIKKG
jgi:hypothetical protein